MEKKYIIRFLNERKRGTYTLLVKTYADLISSLSIKMAYEVIKEDLEKEAGTPVELRYSSLVRAIARNKKKTSDNTDLSKRKWDFKDAHEIKDGHSSPGTFRLG